MLRSLFPLWRIGALAWWRWARRSLQSWNPHHPDLVQILLRIRDLERMA